VDKVQDKKNESVCYTPLSKPYSVEKSLARPKDEHGTYGLAKPNLIHNAVRWRHMYSLESYQPEFPFVSVSHCAFTSHNAASGNCISLKNLTVKEV